MALLKKLIGALLLAFGLIGVAVEIDDAVQGKSKNRMVGIVMSALCLGGGTWLVLSGRKDTQQAQAAEHITRLGEHTPEDHVLAVAKARTGRVTATEVAADTPLEFAEAKAELERLAKEGACQAEVSSEGLVLFRFPEFEDRDAKQDLV